MFWPLIGHHQVLSKRT